MNSSVEEIGQEFEAQVRAMSVRGLGVVDHPNGRTFFVKGPWVGEIIRARVTQIDKTYGFAELLEVSQPSDHRVSAPCSHHGTAVGECGGCPWMSIEYEAQLEQKHKMLLNALERVRLNGDFPKIVAPVIASPKTLGYRNRAQFKTDGSKLGFLSEASHQIVPIKDCLVLNSHNRSILKSLLQALPNPNWEPSDQHRWNFIDIDDHSSADDIDVNRRRKFIQGNTEQNIRMKTWLAQSLENADLSKPIIELFCGDGNLTEVIAAHATGPILAIENSRPAISELSRKELPGVVAQAADLSRPGVWKWVLSKQRWVEEATTIVLDPPRTGLSKWKPVFHAFKNIQNVFYISCCIESFARDAARLQSSGYHMESLQPIDLFPHTPHLEIMAHFKLKA